MYKNYKYHFPFLKKFWFYFFIFFLFIVSGVSQTNITDINQVFQKSLYRFSFSDATKIISSLENSNIDKNNLTELKSQLAWWQILSGYDIDENIKKCNVNLDKNIDFYKNIVDPDINSRVKLINAYLLKLRIENYSDNTIKSLSVLNKLLKRVDKLDNTPENDINKKLIIGLYYYFLEYIKEEFILARAVLSNYNKGNKELGLKYLEECGGSDDDIIKTEAIYFLHKIYFTIEKQYPKAEENIKILLNLYPDNLVFAFEYYKILIAQNKLREAEELNDNTVKKIHDSDSLHEEQKLHFLDLFKNYKVK